MKKHFILRSFHILLVFFIFGIARGQNGRIVINEFLPWPGNSCGTTAEFVELFNMGPGPVNISPAPCANISRNIVADLNWNTCGCTSAPIPTTGDGFMTDGGAATEQVVLLSPTGMIVDAVARGIPAESASNITSSNIGGCPTRTFDLDLMHVNYETIGESAGRGNSIARKLDGDCGWVKDTQQSGGETNNTPGETSDLSISMFITDLINCGGGTARFIVNTAPAASFFPLDYILARDEDGDGQFTYADSYTTGFDFTAPDLTIGILPLGLYSINIGPVQGCSYKNFLFRIGPCIPLAYSLESFSVTKNQSTRFSAELSGGDQMEEIILEGSTNGIDFIKIASIPFNKTSVLQELQYEMDNGEFSYFRLLMTNSSHHASYSPIRKLNAIQHAVKFQLAGNPVKDEIRISGTNSRKENLDIQVINGAGQVLITRHFSLNSGDNMLKIPVYSLTPGLYFVKLSNGSSSPETFKVLKQ
jgi:hypothetical protein